MGCRWHSVREKRARTLVRAAPDRDAARPGAERLRECRRYPGSCSRALSPAADKPCGGCFLGPLSFHRGKLPRLRARPLAGGHSFPRDGKGIKGSPGEPSEWFPGTLPPGQGGACEPPLDPPWGYVGFTMDGGSQSEYSPQSKRKAMGKAERLAHGTTCTQISETDVPLPCASTRSAFCCSPRYPRSQRNRTVLPCISDGIALASVHRETPAGS